MPRISQKFIDRKVRRPDHGQVIYRDDELIGFGLRVTRGSMSYIVECRVNLLEIFDGYLNLDESSDLYRAASYVLSQNLVHGDALTMRTHDGQPITFAEWGYLGKGKFQRRDFRLATLTQSSAFSAEGSLFAHLGKHEIFTPERTYPPATMSELAAMLGEAAKEAVS